MSYDRSAAGFGARGYMLHVQAVTAPERPLGWAAHDLSLVVGPRPDGPMHFAVVNGTDGDDALNGTAAADTLNGYGGSDILYGDANNDTLNGGDGDDYLEGGTGNDTLNGGADFDFATYIVATIGVTVNLNTQGSAQNTIGAGSDTLNGIGGVFGSDFSDTITGDSNANILVGRGGKDTIDGGGGDDLMTIDPLKDIVAGEHYTGGTGYDTLSVAYGFAPIDLSGLIFSGIESLYSDPHTAADGFHIKLTGAQLASFTDLDTADIEITTAGTIDLTHGTVNTHGFIILGGATSITLAGTTTGHSVAGGTGNDSITLGEAGDNASGDGGDDIVQGNGSADLLGGGDGSDTLYGGNGDDALYGGDGTDTVYGGDGDDVMGQDPFYGGIGGSDTYYGGVGNDKIIDDTGADFIYGEMGNDTLDGGADAQVHGGDGDDILHGTTLYGEAGNDQLWAGIGSSVDGGDGNDTIILTSLDALAAAGFHGGGGIDTLDVAVYDSDAVADIQTTVFDGLEQIRAQAVKLTATQFSGLLGLNTAHAYIMTAGMAAMTNGNLVPYVVELDVAGITLDLTGSKPEFGNFVTIKGSDFADVITGSAVTDTIYGGGGDDLVNAGPGADTMEGGDGIDTISYAASSSGINTDIRGSTNENLIGSAFNDTLIGTDGANVLIGGNGNDSLFGAHGDDTMDGGAGVDTADYSFGFSAVTVDLRITTAQAISSEQGMDTFVSIESAKGSLYDDLLIGNDADNTLSGKGGEDILVGGAGNDTLDGGLGFNTASYVWANGGVTVNLQIAVAQAVGADQGSDTLITVENLIGSQFGDVLTGNQANNVLSGLGGDDRLAGGPSNDTLDGGDGIDTADYSATPVGVIVNLTVTGAQTVSSFNTDTLVSIENLVGSNFADTLTGDAAANVLSAGFGDDVIDGGLGNDTLDGSTGTDTVSFASVAAGVTASLATGQATGQGTDTFTGFENVTGSSLDDMLTGDINANTLAGGNGNDTLAGGAGNDRLDGSAGIDTANYAGANGGVTVNLATLTAQAVGADQGSDTLVSIENVTGSAFNDTLTGDGNANVLYGGDGDDTIIGGAGDDVMNGGVGIDTVSYAAGATAGVTVSLFATTAQAVGGGLGTDTLGGFENLTGSSFGDTLTGNTMNNVLTGGNGDDVLDGINGDDILDGGAGNDTLTGSFGIDTFVMSGGGADKAYGGGGDDTFNLGAAFTAADIIKGGVGNNVVNLAGDYSAGVHLNAGTLTDINAIVLGTGFDYVLELNDGTVASGKHITVDATALAAGNSLHLTDTKELDGSLVARGGAGADVISGGHRADTILGNDSDDRLVGGAGADTLDGGLGADTFVYKGGKDSPLKCDTVIGFDTSADTFDLSDAITGVDFLTTGALSEAHFGNDIKAAADTTHLLKHHVLVFTADSGDLAGESYLIVDLDGKVGFGATDMVIHLDTPANLAGLTTANFI